MKIVKEKVSTNNFLISKKINVENLQAKFRVLKYTLSEQQNDFRRFADKRFYAKFTNAYKENFDIPFYYHIYSGLYALAPKDLTIKKWNYKFNESEEIAVSELSFSELEGHILMKLLVALFFYNQSEQLRRVCQSHFFILGKVKGNKLIASQFELKQVSETTDFVEFNIKAGAKNFLKKDKSKISPQYVAADTYYELLIKDGITYLRQLRPSKVMDFTGDVYSNNIPFKMENARLDWYSDAKYKESKSFLIYTFKERFKAFLNSYGIEIIEKEQEFTRLDRIENTSLPLDRLRKIKVYDNRLSQNIPIDRYIGLFRSLYENKLEFELVNNPNEVDHLLIVQDCEAKDFIKDDLRNGILSDGYSDPYKELYLKYLQTPKQSIVVNSQDGDAFNSPADYLNYDFIEDSDMPLFKTKFEVCLNELLLKSILYGQHKPSEILPFLTDTPEIFDWGFISAKTLMYFTDGILSFADLSTKEGKETLGAHFMRWSDLLKAFKSRKPFLQEEEVEDAISKSAFIVKANNIIEIERLDEAVLPEISKIEELKADDPRKSARSRDAITIYSGGVWFNEMETTYIVSGANSMNWREPRAHHLYKIHQYQSNSVISLNTVVKLLCVKFVRNRQFTVYPYFFDLLRLNTELKAIVKDGD